MTLKRVLVVHPYGLGDFLFVTPVLRALRLIPSVEKVDLLLGSRTSEVVRENPHVDEIFVVDKGRYQTQGRGQTFREVVALGLELRSRHYDLMLDYSLRSEYALLGRLFLTRPASLAHPDGCRVRVGGVPDGVVGPHAIVVNRVCAQPHDIPIEHIADIQILVSSHVTAEINHS